MPIYPENVIKSKLGSPGITSENLSDESAMDQSDVEVDSPRVQSELELKRERNIRERDAYLASLMNFQMPASPERKFDSEPNSPRIKSKDLEEEELDKSQDYLMDYSEFEPVPKRIKSEVELQRERNIRERDAYISSFMKDPEFAEAVEAINSFNKPKSKPRPRVRRSAEDVTFSFHGYIPTERRWSARLEKKQPIFTKDDLIDESTFKRKRTYNEDDEDWNDLEEVVYKPKKSRVSHRRSERPPIIPVEQVTDYMIENIARKVSVKKYSDKGSSCHQCRQKTIDQKTSCRNENCVGVRGQFCGVCLENRYGEDAAVALRDPSWHCPVCRGVCNCSFCRARAGKRPTGILTPLAHQSGHKSVKDFLESLKGEGDYAHQDRVWEKFKDPDNLLGFSKDSNIALMGADIEIDLRCSCTSEKLNTAIQKEEKTLEKYIKDYEDPSELAGFSKDIAYTICGALHNLGCVYAYQEILNIIANMEEDLNNFMKSHFKKETKVLL